jgi:UDP-N-acetylmuramoylalanine--D-glutamate ligase
MKLDGKRVVVVGLAQTGIACARFCARRGARVAVTDGAPADKLAAKMAELAGVAVERSGSAGPRSAAEGQRGGSIEWRLGAIDVTGADLVVMSPGVPLLPPIAAARAAGVEVIAEIELAYRFLDPRATLIAITGTNGKSTTTALSGKLCEASGRPTFCGGNLGNMPLIDAVDHPANVPGGLIVAEVAAFMLENCTTFRAHAGVLTNITEDHLDRFGTMERYAEMKGRIWDFQRADDVAIANAGDDWVMRETRGIPSRLYTFGADPSAPNGSVTRGGARDAARGAWIDGTDLVLRLDSGDERYPQSDLVIVGNHNLENAMCAYLAARSCGVSVEAVRAGARAYRPLPHRMELVGDRADIFYYDDSKGTNVASVAASVRGFPRPLVLIAGGVDKGGSYEPMLAALDGVCKGIVLIGKAAPLIRDAAAAHGVRYPVVDATDMHDAVRRATELAGPGDAVVLSPACSSYDMFQNFGHRGRVFRDAVSAVGAKRLDQ